MDDVKKLIRSLLISSPLEMNVGKLNRDYCEVVGESIPFKNLGFQSLEQLLRSIPDVLQVRGNGNAAEVRVVADEKVAHIDRLVSLQRPPQVKKPRFGSRPRRRRHCSALSGQKFSKPLANISPPTNLCTPPATVKYGLFHNQGLLPPPLLPQYPSAALRSYDPYYSPTPAISNQTKATGAIPKIKQQHVNNRKSKQDGQSKLPNIDNIKINKKNSEVLPSKSNILQEQKNEENKYETETESQKSKMFCEHRIEAKDNLVDEIEEEINNTQSHVSALLEPSTEELFFSDFEDDLLEEENYENTLKPAIQQEYINYKVPAKVQQNLETLISNYPKGIWCGDLPRSYKDMFGKQLEYEQYGYTNLIQMCLDLENIFSTFRPANADFLLYYKKRPISDEWKNKLQHQQEVSDFSNKFENAHIIEPDNLGPALVDAEEFINVDEVEFPPGVMQYMDKIPRQFLEEDQVELSFIDVTIGEIYDPSKFWIILNNQELKLNRLMDSLQLFYCAPDTNLKIPQHMIREGLYCVAKYNQEYHRAVIVRINRDKKTVKVFYVDYGTLSTINANGLHYLHKEFADFPSQAIRARLASIFPTTAYTPWPTDASARFLKLVCDKVLVAQPHKIHKEAQIVEIFLVDTTTEKDIHINDTLVTEGYALFTNQKQGPARLHPRKVAKFMHIHLFPTFDDLENGNAPSATEIIRMSKAGIQDEYMYPNYYQDITDDYGISIFKRHSDSTFANLEDTSKSCSVSPNVDDWTKKLEECCNSDKNLQDIQDTISNVLSSSTKSNSNNPTPISSTQPSPTERNDVPITKPPPGFENVPLNYYFTTTINVNNPDNLKVKENADVSLAKNVMVQPPISNNYISTTVTQPLNVLQSQPPQTVNPVVAYEQLQTLINNYTRQQQQQAYIGNVNQNALLNLHPFYYQLNPNLILQQNYLFHQLNNTSFNLQSQELNKTRQTLENILHQYLMENKLELLEFIIEIVKDELNNNPEVATLCRLAYQIMKSPSSSRTEETLEYRRLVMLNLLKSLTVVQIFKLSEKQVLLINNTQNAMYKTADTLRDTTEGLEKLSINPRNETVITCKPSVFHVIEAVLENKAVHIIQYKNSLYMLVNEVLQFTSPKPTLDVLRKTVMLLDPFNCIQSIDLKENKILAEELQRYNIHDATILVVPLILLPDIVKNHCGEKSMIKDFKTFLNEVTSKIGLTVS